MKKSLIVASMAVAVLSSAPSVALAQAAPAPAWTIAGNAGLFSDYRFRGFTQTAYRPAFQGGVDISHSSGFYLGNWNSNVEQALYRGASLEMDLYGGYKGTMGGLAYDVGYIYYYYPSSNTFGFPKADNGEIYFGITYGPVTAKYYHSVTNFFGLGDLTPNGTKGSGYLDVGAAFDLGGGWGVNAHVGYQRVKNGTLNGLPSNSVTDYKVGVTKDLNGWILGAALVGASNKNFFTTGVTIPEGGGKTKAVLSVSKAF